MGKGCIPVNKMSVHEVIVAMNDVIYEHPEGRDFVYKKDSHQNCYYYRQGKPSCIVGQVLHRLVPDYTPREGGTVMSLEQDLRGLGFTTMALVALQIAQRMQDTRHSWGVAFDAAKVIAHSLPDRFFK